MLVFNSTILIQIINFFLFFFIFKHTVLQGLITIVDEYTKEKKESERKTDQAFSTCKEILIKKKHLLLEAQKSIDLENRFNNSYAETVRPHSFFKKTTKELVEKKISPLNQCDLDDAIQSITKYW